MLRAAGQEAPDWYWVVSKADVSATASRNGEREMRVLLINAFDTLPGEKFRDLRYSFLYRELKRVSDVRWLASDFHHWSLTKRDKSFLPVEDRDRIVMLPMPVYGKRVGLRRLISYFSLSLSTLIALCRMEWRPDVIICMGPVEQMFLVVVYARLKRIRSIIDVLDLWPDLYATGLGSRWKWLASVVLAPYFLLSFLTFAWTSEATAVSKTYARWAMRRGRRQDPAKFSYYYLGCRNDDFEVSRSALPDGTLRCLFAGQFGFTYDVELILAAAERFQADGNERLHFVLCGDGEKRSKVERRAAALRNVTVYPWVTPQELNAIARTCQIGLCAYTAQATQSIPNKIFDYLSMGLYVLSSLPGEADDLLREYNCGESYRAQDLDALCAAIIRATRLDLETARSRIRKTFEERFDARTIYPKMVRELILGERGIGESVDRRAAPLPETVQVGPASVEDLSQIVTLHLDAFPGFFLTRIGPAFLLELYRAFVTDPDGVCVVARDTSFGQIVGVVAGTKVPRRFFRRILMRRGLAFAFAAVPGLLRHPLQVARRAFGGLCYRGEQPPGLRSAALLSSLAVSPALANRGVGRRLVEAFCSHCEEQGVAAVYLTTDHVGNEPVNNFYRRCSFELRYCFERSDGRKMNMYWRALESGKRNLN